MTFSKIDFQVTMVLSQIVKGLCGKQFDLCEVFLYVRSWFKFIAGTESTGVIIYLDYEVFVIFSMLMS